MQDRRLNPRLPCSILLLLFASACSPGAGDGDGDGRGANSEPSAPDFSRLAIGKSVSALSGAMSNDQSSNNAIPDVYARTGGSSIREAVADLSGSDTVDPFTGRLRVSVVDLSLRGLGPAIVLTRSYHSESLIGDAVTLDSRVGFDETRTPTRDPNLVTGSRGYPMGVGWTHSFGRVVDAGGPGGLRFLRAGPGTCHIQENNAEWNPYVVWPGGQVEVLYNAPEGSDFDLVTKARSKATCLPEPDGGLLLTNSSGVKHWFSWRGNQINRYEWGLTRIEDPDGNYLTYDYLPDTQIVSSITGSDGRAVTLTYDQIEPFGEKYLLQSVSDGLRTVNYTYRLVPGGSDWVHDKYFLSDVNGPEGAHWHYEYLENGAKDNGEFIAEDLGDAGVFSMSRQVSPFGASTSYVYTPRKTGQRWETKHQRTSAVASKTLSGPSLPAAIWTYEYHEPTTSILDETVVTGPAKQEIYRHCGYHAFQFEPRDPTQTEVQVQCPFMGALLEKDSYDLADASAPVQTERFEWTQQVISPQQEVLARLLDFGCGDGYVDPGEECDSEDIRGVSCADANIEGEQFVDPPSGAGVRCTGCKLDFSACVSPSKCGEPYRGYPTHLDWCFDYFSGFTCEDYGLVSSQRDEAGAPISRVRCSPSSCTEDFSQCFEPQRPTFTWLSLGIFDDLPLLHTTTRDNQTYNTITSNYDDYGNAGLKSEYFGPTLRDANGTVTIPPSFDGTLSQTLYNYTPDLAGWFLHELSLERLTEWIPGQPAGLARTYDPRGHVLHETRNGALTTYSYHPDGTLASTTDPRLNITEYSNYLRGVARTESLPEGVTLTHTVDALGRITSTTRNGRTNTVTFDLLNRPTALGTPRGDDNDVSVAYSFDPPRRTVTRGGLVVTEQLDALGRTVETSGGGITSTTHYDAAGRLVFRGYPNSAQGMETTYDALGRTLDELDTATGATRSTIYLANNRVQVTDEDGNSTTFTYRSFGDPDRRDLMIVDSPLGVTTTLARLQNGDLYTVTQGGLTRTFMRDDRYHVVWTFDPEVGYTDLSYDDSGNLISQSIAGALPTTLLYDGLNRLILTDYPGTTPDASLAYDEDGLLESATAGASEWRLAYDANGNRTDRTLRIDGRSIAFHYAYDANDALASLTYPSGFLVDYAPSVLGRPTRAGSLAPAVTHHPSGALASITSGNGVVQTFTQDARQLPASSRLQSGGSVLQNLTYTFDPAKNLIALTDAAVSSESQTFSYDALNRLLSSTGPWGTGSYTYNTRGDLLTKVTGTESFAFTYSSATGRLSSYTRNGLTRFPSYDATGAQTYDGESVWSTFDDAGHLVNASGHGLSSLNDTYTYDAFGMRVKRVEASQGNLVTYSVYDGPSLLYEQDANGVRREYVNLKGRLLARRVLQCSGSTDTDGDGMTDCDEIKWFFNPHDPSDGALDADGDGKSNAEELALGSDPRTFNTFPTANAGPDRTVVGGGALPIALDGTGSSGAAPLTYSWAWKSGTFIQLNNCPPCTPPTSPATGPTPSFYVNPATDITSTFELTVTDRFGIRARDTVTLTILSGFKDDDADGILDWWETLNFGGISTYDGNSDPDGDGLTNAQEFAEGTNPLASTPPAPVANLVAKTGDGESVLVWSKPRSVTSFNLYYSTVPHVTPATGTRVTGARAPFVHAGTNGTPYYYVVTSVNATGESAPSNEARTMPNPRQWTLSSALPAEQPSTAQLAQASNLRGDRIYVWSELSGATKYVYARRYTLAEGWSAVQTMASSPDPTFTVTKVAAAINDAGDSAVALHGKTGSSIGFVGVKSYYVTPSGPNHLLGWIDESPPGGCCVTKALGGLGIDGAGNMLLTWVDHSLIFAGGSLQYQATLYASILARATRTWVNTVYTASTYGPAVDPGPNYQSSVVFDSQGRGMVHWISVDPASTNGTVGTVAYRQSASSWSTSINHFSGSSVESAIAGDDNGRVTLFYHSTGSTTREAKDYDFATGTWSAPIALPGTAGRKTSAAVAGTRLAMNRAGDSLLAWTESGDPKYRYRSAGGTWGAVGSVGGTSNDGGALFAAIDRTGDATLGWSLSGSVWGWHYQKSSGAGTVVDLNPSGTASDAVRWMWGDYYGDVELAWVSNGTPVLATFKVALPSNFVPAASAGPDQTVDERTAVTLDGSASADSDGTVVSYAWAQTAGPPVTLSGAGAAIASFTAPSVLGAQVLTFRLTVTDNLGAQASDTVNITVRDIDPDTTAPVTAFVSSKKRVKGKTQATITLTPNEPATTFFRSSNASCVVLSGGANTTAWQTYTGAVVIQVGTVGCPFDYYSVDGAGNTEATQTAALN